MVRMLKIETHQLVGDLLSNFKAGRIMWRGEKYKNNATTADSVSLVCEIGCTLWSDLGFIFGTSLSTLTCMIWYSRVWLKKRKMPKISIHSFLLSANNIEETTKNHFAVSIFEPQGLFTQPVGLRCTHSALQKQKFTDWTASIPARSQGNWVSIARRNNNHNHGAVVRCRVEGVWVCGPWT